MSDAQAGPNVLSFLSFWVLMEKNLMQNVGKGYVKCWKSYIFARSNKT